MAKQQEMAVYENEDGYGDTWSIGGGRFALWSDSAFDPQAYVGTTTPVPLALLSIPPTYGNLNDASDQYSAQGQASNLAAQFPFSPKHSPTVYIIAGLVVGLIGLHFLYFNKKKSPKKEG